MKDTQCVLLFWEKEKNPCSSLSGHFEPVQAGSLTRDWKAKTLIAADPQDYSCAPGLRGPHQIPFGVNCLCDYLTGASKELYWGFLCSSVFQNLPANAVQSLG